MTDPTIASLTKRRAELAVQAREADAALKRLLADIEHLDGAIRLYQPDYRIRKVIRRPKRLTALRTALEALRDAKAPMTLREVALHVVTRSGGAATDEALVREAMARTRVALLGQRKIGVVRSVEGPGAVLLWEVAR